MLNTVLFSLCLAAPESDTKVQETFINEPNLMIEKASEPEGSHEFSEVAKASESL